MKFASHFSMEINSFTLLLTLV